MHNGIGDWSAVNTHFYAGLCDTLHRHPLIIGSLNIDTNAH